MFRFDPDVDAAGRYDVFNVPAERTWTIADALDYIAENFDSSLAYYRHSACDHGICGRCAVKVDGVARLACSFRVGDATELTVDPMRSEVVRDLVVVSGKRGGRNAGKKTS